MNPFKKIITLSAVALSTAVIVNSAYATEDDKPDVVPAPGAVTVNANPIDKASAEAAKDVKDNSSNSEVVQAEVMPTTESKSAETEATQEVRAETPAAPVQPATSEEPAVQQEVREETPAASVQTGPAAEPTVTEEVVKSEAPAKSPVAPLESSAQADVVNAAAAG